MKITRRENCYTIRCTPNEFDLLGICVDQVEMGDPREFIAEPNLRKSWGRRAVGGQFLRIDRDLRKDTAYD